MGQSLWEAGRAGAFDRRDALGGTLRFKNPFNGYVETVDNPGLWCLLFGCFYLAYKGAWMAAVLAFFLAWLTFGLSWLAFPFFARRIVAKSYLQRGWRRVDAAGHELGVLTL